MKIPFTFLVFSAYFAGTTLFADALSNSLNNMLKTTNQTGMVNLNGVGVGVKRKPKPKMTQRTSRPESSVIGRYHDGKRVLKKEANAYLRKVTKGKIKDLDLLPKKQRLIVLKDLKKIYAMRHFKSRASSSVIATVNGNSILKKEADSYLKLVTRGKAKDFDRLDKKQRFVLIQDLARPILIELIAENELSQTDKEEIFKQVWLRKQHENIKVNNEEMLALYESKKEKALSVNPNAQIPPYISLGESLRNEVFEQKMVKKLMKDANVSVHYDNIMTAIENGSKEVVKKKIISNNDVVKVKQIKTFINNSTGIKKNDNIENKDITKVVEKSYHTLDEARDAIEKSKIKKVKDNLNDTLVKLKMIEDINITVHENNMSISVSDLNKTLTTLENINDINSTINIKKERNISEIENDLNVTLEALEKLESISK